MACPRCRKSATYNHDTKWAIYKGKMFEWHSKCFLEELDEREIKRKKRWIRRIRRIKKTIEWITAL